MSNHVMVDIETLDTTATAVVLSIGAVAFDPRGNERMLERYWKPIDITEQVDRGRTVDTDTFQWWMRQADPARREIAKKPIDGCTILADALTDLRNFIRDVEPAGVWGNGSDFDNAILQHAAKSYGVGELWPYWASRCFRTFAAIHDPDRTLRVRANDHNALEDAINQAEWMRKIVANNPFRGLE